MVLAIEALPLPANMYGHVIDAYKFVKRRSGTRIERREHPQESFQQTLGSLSDLVELAAATDRDIRGIDTVVMDRQAARRFGCQPGSRWRRIAYVRRSAKRKSPPLACSMSMSRKVTRM